MITILGSTGMLGNAVGNYFLSKHEDVALSYRDESVAYGENRFQFDPLVNDVKDIFRWSDPEYVINCIGVIKPFIDKDPIASIQINSIFPRELANACEERGVKLIHITTDCVFSGRSSSYNENSLHDCEDFYGKTKSCGEPANCMVIRTSIIGEEIHKNASLIEWAKSQKGKQVNGFTNHLWNGIATKEYARICDKIISDGLFQNGIHHVFGKTISKCDLLKLISDKLGLDLQVNPIQAPQAITRVLSTVKDLNGKLAIRPLAQQF